MEGDRRVLDLWLEALSCEHCGFIDKVRVKLWNEFRSDVPIVMLILERLHIRE